MVSVKVFSVTVSVLVILVVIVGIYAYMDGDVEKISKGNGVEPIVNLENGSYLIEKCDVSFGKCKNELEETISRASVGINEREYFENYSSGNSFFEKYKGEKQESLRRELSSFNSGDVDDLFPVVLYSVTLVGAGGTSDLVIVCNSFGDLEQTSKNWLIC